MGSDDAIREARERYGHDIPFREGLKVWLRVAMLSFGGPAGQIAVMHRILVVEKKWVSEGRFLHALNYCMLLPGPEAQQLATYLGWLLHRTRGGLVAGTLFVLPGFLAILALSIVYAGFGGLSLVQALFFGIKAAVLAIVIAALLRLGRRVLKSPFLLALAGGAFVAIFFLDVAFPLIVLGAGVLGFLGSRLRPAGFAELQQEQEEEEEETGDGADPSRAIDSVLAGERPSHLQPSWTRAAKVCALGLTLWFAPLAALLATVGGDNVFTRIGLFFSKLAVVTFGGAYAVLAYMAQEAVQNYGWLAPGEMLDGLGMAETTPGPLIQVVQFVAFLGAFRDAGALSPYTAGVLASVLATWVTFVPCFLWIFLGAPYVEQLRGQRSLNAALSGITAAVVGVMLNLALWFGLHVAFAQVEEVQAYGLRLHLPVLQTLNLPSALLTAAALLALLRFRLGMLPVLGLSAALGIALHLALGLAV